MSKNFWQFLELLNNKIRNGREIEREKGVAGNRDRNGKKRGREKIIFPATGKIGNGKNNFFPGTGRRKTIFPFPSLPRGNPNGISCFPVRRTGTLLVPNKRQMRKRTFTSVAVR